MPQAHSHEQSFTLAQAKELGDALIPRIKEAISPELDALEKQIVKVRTELSEDLQKVRRDLAFHRGRSSLFGALGGVVTALAAVLTQKHS